MPRNRAGGGESGEGVLLALEGAVLWGDRAELGELLEVLGMRLEWGEVGEGRLAVCVRWGPGGPGSAAEAGRV